MSQNVTQSIQTDLVTYITDTSNVPKTGLIFSSVTAAYRKEGQNSFTSKTLTSLNFVEIGSGVYTITFTAAELNTLGAFTWIVNGSGLTQFVGVANVVPAANTSTGVTVSMCTVTGHLIDLDGSPLINSGVSARILGFPTLISNYGIGNNLVSTVTDDNGMFSLSLVQGVDVNIIIPDINYERQITVPALTTVDLFVGIP